MYRLQKKIPFLEIWSNILEVSSYFQNSSKEDVIQNPQIIYPLYS